MIGRLFKDMINCSGRDTYFHSLGKLQYILNEAISNLGGLQQPPHSTSEEHARIDEVDRAAGWKIMEQYAQDIVCALLGSKYKVVSKGVTHEEESFAYQIKELREEIQNELSLECIERIKDADVYEKYLIQIMNTIPKKFRPELYKDLSKSINVWFEHTVLTHG